MTISVAPALRTLAFGDLDAGLWGAAWGSHQPFLSLGAPGATGAVVIPAATIDGWSESQQWELSGDGVELVVSGEGEAATTSSLETEAHGFDQLCRVSGRFAVGGTEHSVDCLGRRSSHAADVDFRRFESVREVSAWFDPDQGLALMAFRPRGAAGHDGDLVSAALLEAGYPVPVGDPRLSTTYDAEGSPARASLELWLGDEESEQYPRRAAGEALGPRARGADAELDLQAALFRWHMREREGAGVYMIVRPR